MLGSLFFLNFLAMLYGMWELNSLTRRSPPTLHPTTDFTHTHKSPSWLTNILPSLSFLWILSTLTGFLQLLWARSTHTVFWSVLSSEPPYFPRLWTLGVVSLCQQGACDLQAILSSGMTCLPLSWPGSAWPVKPGPSSRSGCTRGEEPCSHGSRCVGAMAWSVWGLGCGKAAWAGGRLTVGSCSNFGRK